MLPRLLLFVISNILPARLMLKTLLIQDRFLDGRVMRLAFRCDSPLPQAMESQTH